MDIYDDYDCDEFKEMQYDDCNDYDDLEELLDKHELIWSNFDKEEYRS